MIDIRDQMGSKLTKQTINAQFSANHNTIDQCHTPNYDVNEPIRTEGVAVRSFSVLKPELEKRAQQ